MAHYIDKKELYHEICISKEQDELTPKAQAMLIKLANRIITKMSYDSYDDKKDCLQEGLLALFARWRSFKPEKSENAFAYYTEVFKRGSAKGYNEITDKKLKKKVSMNASEGSSEGFLGAFY